MVHLTFSYFQIVISQLILFWGLFCSPRQMGKKVFQVTWTKSRIFTSLSAHEMPTEGVHVATKTNMLLQTKMSKNTSRRPLLGSPYRSALIDLTWKVWYFCQWS